MVAVGHGLMPAAGSMNMPRLMTVTYEVGRAHIGIAIAHFDRVLVNMVAVNVVEVTIVDVVDVIAMPDSRVAAARPMLVGVIFVLRVRTITHVRLQAADVRQCKPYRHNSIPEGRSQPVPANRLGLTTYFLP